MGGREEKQRAHEDCEANQIDKVAPIFMLAKQALLAPETPGEERIKRALREREIDDRVVILGEKRKRAPNHGKCECSRRDSEGFRCRAANSRRNLAQRVRGAVPEKVFEALSKIRVCKHCLQQRR